MIPKCPLFDHEHIYIYIYMKILEQKVLAFVQCKKFLFSPIRVPRKVLQFQDDNDVDESDSSDEIIIEKKKKKKKKRRI